MKTGGLFEPFWQKFPMGILQVSVSPRTIPTTTRKITTPTILTPGDIPVPLTSTISSFSSRIYPYRYISQRYLMTSFVVVRCQLMSYPPMWTTLGGFGRFWGGQLIGGSFFGGRRVEGGWRWAKDEFSYVRFYILGYWQYMISYFQIDLRGEIVSTFMGVLPTSTTLSSILSSSILIFCQEPTSIYSLLSSRNILFPPSN